MLSLQECFAEQRLYLRMHNIMQCCADDELCVYLLNLICYVYQDRKSWFKSQTGPQKLVDG